jgi:hypothetical protein
MELLSLADFHAAQRAGRLIVITDTATGDKVHQSDCPYVTDDNFIRKVIEGHGKNGRYFAESALDEAVRVHRATPCPVCNP